MKKALLIIGLIFFMTGCTTKTLTCTKEDNSVKDMKTHQKAEVTFSSNKVVKLYSEATVEVSGIYKNYVNQLEQSLLQSFTSLKDKKGVTVVSDKKEDRIVVKATIDINKLDKETKKTFNLVDTKQDYEQTKKELKDQGYTCK